MLQERLSEYKCSTSIVAVLHVASVSLCFKFIPDSSIHVASVSLCANEDIGSVLLLYLY